MDDKSFKKTNSELLKRLEVKQLSPFDLIPQADLREKLVELVINGIPEYADNQSSALFRELCENFEVEQVSEVRVVVFGGGTGLSNIIGGDCRQDSWVKRPFEGLKKVFPKTRAIVCVTDDGGSTGELLKDIPLIAVGDIRHVLLSSIQKNRLVEKYRLTEEESFAIAAELFKIFNYRFLTEPGSPDELIQMSKVDLDKLPLIMVEYIVGAIEFCFKDKRCCETLKRPQCLGNIIIISVLMRSLKPWDYNHKSFTVSKESDKLLLAGLSECAEVIGAASDSVLPSTFTPSQLRFLYTNGIEVSGEKKSSEAQRGYPVDSVYVDFCDTPYVSESALEYIREADILIMAPGSLYSSLLPVFQVPGIAEAVRENKNALKLLIANLWVQAGETDQSISDPERKFHVSDMIRAYHRNLPGGTKGLFDQILCLSLKDVPASVIQNYAVEGKIPIYLDKELLKAQGFSPVECSFFSKDAMNERQVIQHDSHIVSRTVKTLFLTEKYIQKSWGEKRKIEQPEGNFINNARLIQLPSVKFKKINDKIRDLPITITNRDDFVFDEDKFKTTLIDIIWEHKDIRLSHLENIRGITCVAVKEWRRDQRWDNVFSYYDPKDGQVNIRQDRFEDRRNLEIALLITVGQALLGDYAAEKKVETLFVEEMTPGSIFHLYLKKKEERTSFFNDEEIQEYLQQARMIKQSESHFTRIINGNEGFTPPGLLFGIMYAWYLNNMFASHIEYKMSVLKVKQSDLIPEQLKMMNRRERLITFFRHTVFGKNFKMI